MDNEPIVERLSLAYRIAGVSLGVEIVAWVLSLAI